MSELLKLRNTEKMKRNYETKWSLGLIGFLGVMLAITRSASSDWDWVRENTLVFRLCAVFLCTVFVGVSLERSTVIQSLWEHTVTKFLVSIILSGVVLYARGKAAGIINEIFHIDASALPITLVFSTAILVLKLLLPFIIVLVAILFAMHTINSLVWLHNEMSGKENIELTPLYYLLSAFVSAVIVYYGWGWSTNQLSDSRVPEKIYLMAYALEFNHVHECSNVAPDQPVVFLGNAQEAVLVAPEKLVDFSFSDFFEATVSVPSEFVRQRCEYKSKPSVGFQVR
ncbi:hypothetical protein IB258_07825 [Achromobacter sp. ACM02]|uniref:hypothetical protein n=1 Tax=Achromobacter sp. ACM02 TaxID=2769305 RepID=UPI001780E9CE|nr:hypothetical protein [Achromobacter sp. ACM02]MBD9381144.1 hypothetical protein [Achromobacter sp. ACM02]